MNRFVSRLVAFTALLFAVEVESLDFQVGSCECGAFRMTPDSSEPILYRTLPLSIPCDAMTCQRLCVSLAEAAGTNGNELLCATLVDVDSLIVGIKVKSCDQDQWVFTGLKSESICCADGKVVACQ